MLLVQYNYNSKSNDTAMMQKRFLCTENTTMGDLIKVMTHDLCSMDDNTICTVITIRPMFWQTSAIADTFENGVIDEVVKDLDQNGIIPPAE